MVNAVLFTSDARLGTEVYIWMKELAKSVRLKKTYRTLEQFKEEVEGKEKDQKSDPAQSEGAADPANQNSVQAPSAESESQEEKYIRIVIVDSDLIEAKPIQWITDLKQYLNTHGFVEPEKSVQIIVMTFGGIGSRVETFQNEIVDDLILKPLDRSLFLQKVELLSGESSGNASFLYRQKTNQTIEVGKDIIIDEISEFAIAMRNPGPLTEGVFAAVHCDAFGEKANRRMIARVYESVRHPVREGEYLVKFSFFGITPDQLTNVRKYVRNNQTQLRLKALSEGRVGSLPRVETATKQTMPPIGFLRTRKIAVIDMNFDIVHAMKSCLESTFRNLTIKHFPSYARLIGEIKRLTPVVEIAPIPSSTPTPAEPAPTVTNSQATAPEVDLLAQLEGENIAPEHSLPGGGKLTLTMRGKTYEVVRFENLERDDLILGLSGDHWIQKPDSWMAAVEKDDLEGLMEFFNGIEGGNSGQTSFRMRDSSNRLVYLMAVGALEKSGSSDGSALIKLEIEQTDEAKWKEIAPSATSHTVPSDLSQYKFEAIAVDAAYIRPDVETWYNSFTEILRAANIIGPTELPPKIIVLVDPRSAIRPEDLRFKGISDFIYKPIDRRFIMQKFPALLSHVPVQRDPDHHPFVPCELQGRIGKEVVMDELSEFGLSILQPSPFREKIYMRFFSKLFGEEGGWIAGRCLHCEKGKEGEPFRCHFTFFGATDDLLKRIRTWIREDYVARKESAEKKA